jgi:mono/diheme cytochrome c family protein
MGKMGITGFLRIHRINEPDFTVANKRAEGTDMKFLFAVLTITLAIAGNALAQSKAQTMHDTYCVACHGTEVYTREGRLARDYPSLREQVQRWQANVNLGWSDADIDAVAAWLAERYYGLSCPEDC